MNSKEALEFLTEYSHCQFCSKYEECHQLDESESVCENAKFIIKKELNRLEQLEKENLGVKDDNTRLWHSLECANNEISKFKTAINILNKFNFKVETTNCNRTGYEMYTDSLLEYEPLTKEEYDLLKEVLESVGEE